MGLAHRPEIRATSEAASLEVIPAKNAGSITSSLRGRICSVSEAGTARPPSFPQSAPELALHVVAKKKE